MTAAGAIDTSDLSTQDAVDAARTAIAGLRGALTAAADVSDADKAPYQTALRNAENAVDEAQGGINTATRRTNQMTALSGASSTLQAALTALSGSTPTQAEIDDARAALTAMNGAISNATDLTDEEKAPYQLQATNASAPIQTAQSAVNNAKDKADDDANKAMVAKAMKLYDGISALSGTGANTRTAAYSGSNDSQITVTIGTGEGSSISLSENKKVSVAAHQNWQGKQYTAAPTDGNKYTAVVYSNVGEATPGAKFSVQYPYNAREVDGANTERTIDTSDADEQKKIASSSFDQGAGKKEFELGDNDARVVKSGTYHGVDGDYYCAPADNAKCTATVAGDGFTLTGGTWTFKATDKDDRLMDTPDSNYESYGWWIREGADGKLTVGAFADNKGTETTVNIATLRGTATYMGGAAGKYAISNPTGSPNDAGDFTADVELNATFASDGHKIGGTIDNFMGADGKSRDWEIELREATLANDGNITRTGNNQADNDTVWTIGGTAAPASGEWSGSLQEEKDDVPTVATGTFYSTYNRDGRIVGAFGANKK